MSARTLGRILSSFLFASGALLAGPASAAVDQAAPDAGLRGFLQRYAKDQSVAPDKDTRYLAASVKLNEAGPASEQVLVYLLGREWCGTGGCDMLVLDHVGSDYKIVSEISIVQLPVRILQSRSHEWRDIAVWVQGGGIQPGYEARLRFNGKIYPGNPSLVSVSPSRVKPKGTEVMRGGDSGVPLYP